MKYGKYLPLIWVWCYAYVLIGQSQTVYLVGDIGERGGPKPNPVLQLLERQISDADPQTTVIFLGDNIYRGLDDKESSTRIESEETLRSVWEIFHDYPGNVYFIPGEEDWAGGNQDGNRRLRNQELFIESNLYSVFNDSVNRFLPNFGCPGPVEVDLTDELSLIILDTQWWLHPWEKSGEEDGCEIEEPMEILDELENLIIKNAHKKIIVASHHPVYSTGVHGGNFSFRSHLFPLTHAQRYLYLPLPLVGSLYPFYRQTVGGLQDLQYPRYRALRHKLDEIFQKHPNLIHVSGHDQSLQYHKVQKVHYIVSGAGADSAHVGSGKHTEAIYQGLGFAKLRFDPSGKVGLEFWSPNSDLSPLYTKLLFDDPYRPPVEVANMDLDFSDSTILVNASDQYHTTSPGLFGENYRDTWKTEIEVPLFDIGRVNGGLKIEKKGGGQQTRSLRLEDADGREYVLRSVEKYAARAVPEAFRGTIAADLVQDQISASHPYAAFVIPPLADAAEVYHTNPKLVYIPDDPRLGKYREEFANSLALFEERPDDEHHDVPSFGSVDKIVGTPTLLEKMDKDNDHQVDQLWVLKSRLFDMIIGDWDRHDDQWRWAKIEKEKGGLYRPIPRDRDQVFFVNDGFLMRQAGRKWAMPKFQGFDHELSYVPGFNYNARYFDRSFLNEPSLADWIQTADTLQRRLTDEVIESAIKQWPKPVYDLDGPEVISKLKSMRDRIKDYAIEQYLFLAEEVDIRGSNKKEYFLVERMDDESTRVRMYKRTKHHERELLFYDRTFKRSETKEIRLFGLEGEDVFDISGEVDRGIRVRIIGGPDKDSIMDKSSVSGWAKKTIVYDTRGDNTVDLSSESKDRRSQNPGVNQYDRKVFKYNRLIPLVLLQINRDDGLFLGGGAIWRSHGFRKDPYKTNHLLTATGALATGAFNIHYQGTFTTVFGNWDLAISADLSAPNSVTNFFGWGNETKFNQQVDRDFNLDRAIDYYRIRYKFFNQKIMLQRSITDHLKLRLGHHFQAANVERDYDGEDRFFLDFGNFQQSEGFFDWKAFSGFNAELELDWRDHAKLPTRGIYWNTTYGAYTGLNDISHSFSTITSELSTYVSVRLPALLTLALRLGGGHNFESTEFYQAQQLGGLTNLRGYRRTRFFGDSRLHQNTELRLKVATIRSPIIPFSVGLNAFNDVGRVWLDGEDSDEWHHGYGGGIWVSPLNQAVLSLELSESEETFLFNFRLGFLF